MGNWRPPIQAVDPMCRARGRSHRVSPLQITGKHLLQRISLLTGAGLVLAPRWLRRPAGYETVGPAKAVIVSEAKQSRGDDAHPRSRLLRRLRLLAMTTFVEVVSFLAVGLRSSDAWGQYYIGGQAGWTGLPYETDAIAGVGSVPVEFSAGYNVGVRGGYQLGPWRFEEEYSYRRNNVAEYGAGDDTYAVSGNRHTHSIMTNVLYDVTTGWPVTPHIGVGIGAMNVFDGLRGSGGGPVFNNSSWQFAYQAIAGIRYDISPVFALDLDYRYLATTESTFGIPNTNLSYRTGDNTNNFVLSLTYRFGVPLPSETPAPPPPTSP